MEKQRQVSKLKLPEITRKYVDLHKQLIFTHRGQPKPFVVLFRSGKPVQSLPTEPTVADSTARFRVTSDMASSLAVDTQPTGGVVVNSVGDILRHEKLRRLKKVRRLFWGGDFLREFVFLLLP